jgi:hypothetical protein
MRRSMLGRRSLEKVSNVSQTKVAITTTDSSNYRPSHTIETSSYEINTNNNSIAVMGTAYKLESTMKSQTNEPLNPYRRTAVSR